MPTATQNTYYTYTPNGQLLTETTGDLVTSYEYNNAGLVTKKTNKVGDVEPGSVYGGVSDFSTHTYYTNGNMMSKFSQADLCDTSYTYDGAGRLTLEFFQSSGSDYQTIYQYDASGNRSRQTYIFDPYNETNDLFTTVTEYTYDANNRLTSVTTGTDTLSYTYDNNGNMLSESNGKTYSYNALNQLVSFYDGEEYTTTYTYLPNGLRASKTSGNNENHIHSDFVWDGDDLVYEYVRNMYYYPPLNNCIVYNYGNGLISQSNTETNEYILFTKNTHGDVSDMLNAASTDLAVFEDKEFDAFGNGGTTQYSSMGYAGQYHDYETGFIYLRARYYNPAIGRFISEDPHWNVENMIYGDEPETDDENQPVKPNYSSIVQSSNLYPYCTNNPVRLVDPSGEFAITFGLIVKAVATVVVCTLTAITTTSCGDDDYSLYERGRKYNSNPNTLMVVGGLVFGGLSKNSSKLLGEMGNRGWTTDSVCAVVSNPYTTRKSTNKANDNPATAYYTKDGDYVVVDDVTNEVIQISKVGDRSWFPDSAIENPYYPD